MIRDLRNGQKLTAQQLAERLAQAAIVLVGERHDNPDHQALELWIMQVLADRRAQGSLLMEMLNPGQQSKVDEITAAFKSTDPANIPTALEWQDGWDWALYGPIVRYALGQPYPLLSANLSPDEICAIYSHQPTLTGTHSSAPAVRELLQAHIGDAYDHRLPEESLPGLLAVQQQRHRCMAQRLLVAPAPALLFASAYHVRKDIGVPLHLLDLGAVDGAVVLMLAEVGVHVTSAAADYVWYTGALSGKDYGG
jgi:uncharacterized iron-regulated protein